MAFARQKRRQLAGFTLIELMVVITILILLSGMVLPMARASIRRHQEQELRADLQTLRDAIDAYKDAADRGFIQKADSYGYPKNLESLTKGVEMRGGKTLRFLREIPVDPMTGKAEWGMHSMEDDPESDSFDETNVWDVYSKADGVGLDGTRYRTW